MDRSSPREPAQHPFLPDASAAHRQATTASRRLKGLRKASPSTHRFSPRSPLQPTAFTFISAARRFSIRSPSSVCPSPRAHSFSPAKNLLPSQQPILSSNLTWRPASSLHHINNVYADRRKSTRLSAWDSQGCTGWPVPVSSAHRLGSLPWPSLPPHRTHSSAQTYCW